MDADRREGCACSGHVTGQSPLRGRGSRKGLERVPTNTMLFSDFHLAKLNPQMSYELFGLFVTEKAILKKMSVGGNISDKKVNRKEGNFYFFFKEHFQYSANVVLTNIWFPEREHEIRQF